MKAKTYILMKDLPGAKIGREIVDEGLFVFREPTTRAERMYRFNEDEILNNPTWFKLKEEARIEIDFIAKVQNSFNYGVKIGFNKPILEEKYPLIKKAIEDILNEEPEPTPQNIKEESGFSLNERVNIPVSFWDIFEKKVVIKKLEGVIVKVNNVSNPTKVGVNYFNPEKNHFERRVFDVNQIEKIN